MPWMFTIVLVVFAGVIAALFILWQLEQSRHEKTRQSFSDAVSQAEKKHAEQRKMIGTLQQEVKRLKPWVGIADADERAKAMIEQAETTLAQAEHDASVLVQNAEAQYEKILAKGEEELEEENKEAVAKLRENRNEAKQILLSASARAGELLQQARTRAEEIAGDAAGAVEKASLYESTARAMKNIIDGYGDEYLKPASDLLDDLAEEYSHKDAGRELKLARDHTKSMIKERLASACDYVEDGRRERAENFVLDAFNGKVESILTRVKHDNAGKLEQEIRDAFATVNFNGRPFRQARITEPYLAARLEELKWAAITQELKQQEREEQRRIREQIKEEEKARKEYERAKQQAEKEEKAVRKALAEAEARLRESSDAQKAEYEAQLAELNQKLQEVEESSQRAISMAQQTRKGHIYIISNTGSFGDNVYKIGMTRRLEPTDRVKELGDSSVPFSFDIHAMILSDDAPALEATLHKHFVEGQINKVNHRKEFFRLSIQELREEIERLGYEAKWTMAAEAAEYRESLAIERSIAENPEAREAWLNRQLTLDPVEFEEIEGIVESRA